MKPGTVKPKTGGASPWLIYTRLRLTRWELSSRASTQAEADADAAFTLRCLCEEMPGGDFAAMVRRFDSFAK